MREKIIAAAIDTLEHEGLPRVTIRAVAKRAGVNSAAINYYFRSKENLLNEVFRSTVEHSAGDLEAILTSDAKDPRAVIKEFLYYLMEGAVLYPGLTKAQMHDVLVGRRADNLFLRRFNGLLDKLAAHFKALKPAETVAALRMKAVQAAAAVMLPALMPRAFRILLQTSFEDRAAREAYIASLIDALLG
jgi:TetR/AcrR family transcriptional regulator, regulator of cefoperazone and chloramphenicol sensitivity